MKSYLFGALIVTLLVASSTVKDVQLDPIMFRSSGGVSLKRPLLSSPKLASLSRRKLIPIKPPAPIQTAYNRPVMNIGGNSYSPGNCTWFVKSVRPDIPNSWGNADTWFYNAQAQGWATGSTPRVGAIATARGYMHVAIVTGISGNAVMVREMNYNGFGVISDRKTNNSEWLYIY